MEPRRRRAAPCALYLRLDGAPQKKGPAASLLKEVHFPFQAQDKESETMRSNNRADSALRPITIETGFTRYAEGSVLISLGETRVLCNASVIKGVPPFLLNTGKGWITAEYSLLPRATATRTEREAVKGRQSGRTLEIQRLIGRSLRASADLKALDGYTVVIDCDVLQADGGTRCASITGGWVALSLAMKKLLKEGRIQKNPVIRQIAAVSAGMSGGMAVLDMDYVEDSSSDTDMNFIMTDAGGFVEIQGTAEGSPFSENDFDALRALAAKGIKELMAAQKVALQ